MLEPDLDIGREFVEANKPPGRMLLCAVTGSHHYGFPSSDSDIDLKGIHLSPTESLLGLEDPVETRDLMEVYRGVECDLTSHEIKKALKMLLLGNGNMLERIMSPFQLFETREQEVLVQFAQGAISRRFSRHYQGYFLGMRREHERDGQPRAKSLLYTYRVSLTGIHLMRTGQLEANLNLIAPEYGFGEIVELIDFKKENGEKSEIPMTMNNHLKGRWGELDLLFEEAIEASPLPAEPGNRNAVEDWLRSVRIDSLNI